MLGEMANLRDPGDDTMQSPTQAIHDATLPPTPTKTLCRQSRLCRLRKQRLDEGLRVELAQVFHALPEADEAHGYPVLLHDAQNDAALGRSVELGQHHTGDRERVAEQLHLLHRVLPGGRI